MKKDDYFNDKVRYGFDDTNGTDPLPLSFITNRFCALRTSRALGAYYCHCTFSITAEAGGENGW